MSANTELFVFTALGQVPSAVLNDMQDRTLWTPGTPTALTGEGSLSLDPYTGATTSGPDGYTRGPGGVYRYGMTSTSGHAAGTVLCLDDSVDWRNRLMEVNTRVFTASTPLPGQSAAGAQGGANLTPYLHNSWATQTQFWPGNGAIAFGSSPGVNPSAGLPPPNPYSTSGAFTENIITTANALILYVEFVSPYRLCIYNNSGSTYWYQFIVRATTKWY